MRNYSTLVRLIGCLLLGVFNSNFLHAEVSSSEKEFYAFVINVQEEAAQRDMEKLFIELTDSMGITIHTEGLNLKDSSLEETVQFCRFGFFKNDDFKVPDINISGVIQGSLCGDTISNKSFFFIINCETLITVDPGKTTTTDLRSKLKKELGKIKIDKEEQPLVFVYHSQIKQK